MYFDKPGKENTTATLEAARDAAREFGVRYVVVASTWGDTGVEAARLFQEEAAHIIVVSHNTGFKDSGVREFDSKARDEVESRGGTVHTGTMVLRGLGTAVRGKGGYTYEQVVADTLRMLGQGIKVCVEIAAMAADAGLIPPEDIIAIAGTGKGADTAALIKAESSNRFFAIKVREIIVKPRDF